MTWRTGHKVGRTIYNEKDELIGVMDTPELAAIAAQGPEAEELRGLRAELAEAREVLRWLDARGGLGYDAHARIEAVLEKGSP